MVKQRFKPKLFGVYESDIIIDFQKKTVDFVNPEYFYKGPKILKLTLFFFFAYLLLFLSLLYPFRTTSNILFTVLSPFLSLGLGYVTVVSTLLTQSPKFLNFQEKIVKTILRRNLKPRKEHTVKNPIYFKTTVYGTVEILLVGECSKYCDKAVIKRGKHGKATLEVSFLKQKPGLLIVKEY